MPECSKTSASLNTAARQPSKNAEMQRTRRAQEHFELVKSAVLACDDKYTIGADTRNPVQMQTLEALLEYAKKPPERYNDQFDIIWNAADQNTKDWIEKGLLERGFQKNAQNKERWDKMKLLPAQASGGAAHSSVSQGQDATNPYIVSFVSTARPPTPVLASNSRAVVF
jgi:hypothetical protein